MYRVDVYLRIRRAVIVEGMSIRETAREFGLHRDTVRKMLAYSVPPASRPCPDRDGVGASAGSLTLIEERGKLSAVVIPSGPFVDQDRPIV